MARRSRAAAGSAPKRDARNKNGQPSEVAVRMYRQGLGDCFLLTFPRKPEPLYMLIDCGVLLGTEGQNEWMEKVAQSIGKTTKNHIDILVATHEHWDHLSGFLQAGGVFDQITVGEVWFAWTEDPQHELANKLRQGREAARTALAAAHLRLQAVAPAAASELASVLEFSGPLPAAGRKTIQDALKYVRGKVTQPRYCRPGSEPMTLAGVEGVRIYVLGPPEDEKLIKKSDPTKKGREVYELAAAAEDDRSFLVAMSHHDKAFEYLDGDERRDYELNLPFDVSHRIPIDRAKADGFFQDVYYGEGAPGDEDDRWSWRQIETDWLGVANDLALRLDNDTNNTSLALAIELSPGGDVLLFPGDAQVGNWLSWGDLAWPRGANPEDGAITAERLLARTVLYKVGHHASHNATLRDKGLELMTSPHLAAMIPVDEQVAREKKKWDMPFGPLLRRLEEKTKGRIIRADRTFAALKAGPKPAGLADDAWQAFCARLAPDPKDELFLEYRIPLAGDAAR